MITTISLSPEITMVSPLDLSPSPQNPRKRFLQSRLAEMADSIRQHGVLQPLIVREVDGRYELIAGERRARGAMLVYRGYEDAAGVSHEPLPELLVPVMVRVMSDAEVFEVMLVENLEREALSPSEEAGGYAKMMEEFGLSVCDVAARLGVTHQRVSRMVGLLALPNIVLARVDDGDLPLYVADEALRVPAEWSGGEDRMDALRLAEEAGSPGRARELIEARYLRPAREGARWTAPENLARIAALWGDDVKVLPYSVCREVFPSGVTVLTPVTAGLYALASVVPSPPVVHFAIGASWGDMATAYGAERYAACDGVMGDVLLVRRDLVAEAARTRHTQEVSVVRWDSGGVPWVFSADEAFLNVGDKVALVKLTQAGELPQGFVGGRIYVVADLWDLDGGQAFSLADGPGGVALPVNGALADGCRVALLDLTRCPFLPVEGRVAVEAVRQEVAEAAAVAEATVRARAALAAQLVGELEMAIRAECGRERGCDVLLAKAVQFVVAAGAIGYTHEEHPGSRLLVALERPEDEHGVFSGWAGMGESRAGVESFAVCAWVLYWLDVWEGEDLRGCPQWREAGAAYGV